MSERERERECDDSGVRNNICETTAKELVSLLVLVRAACLPVAALTLYQTVCHTLALSFSLPFVRSLLVRMYAMNGMRWWWCAHLCKMSCIKLTDDDFEYMKIYPTKKKKKKRKEYSIEKRNNNESLSAVVWILARFRWGEDIEKTWNIGMCFDARAADTR